MIPINKKRLANISRNKILLTLLNLDWQNEQKVSKFRGDYHLYVLPTFEPSSKELKAEFEPLIEIIKDYLDCGDLTNKQIALINEKLKEKTFSLTKIKPDEIRKTNYYLDPSPESYDFQIEKLDKPQFAFISTHKNALVIFWEEFAQFVVRNEIIRNCACCGRYYIPKAKSHRQKFCSPFCQDKYKKRKKYHENKSK